MEENPTNKEKSNRGNRLVRVLKKAVIWGAIAWVLNFALEKSGWEGWPKFSDKVDSFTGSMLSGAYRLSPINLWNSITGKTYVAKRNEDNYFYPATYEEKKTSLSEKFTNMLGYYWYNDEGDAFWFGRLIFIIAIIAGIGLAYEEYQSSNKSGSAALLFVVNIVLKFFIFLLSLGIIALGLYLVIKLLLLIVGGIVALVTTLKAAGGMISFIIDEIKSEAAESSKKSISGFLLPFLSKLRITKSK